MKTKDVEDEVFGTSCNNCVYRLAWLIAVRLPNIESPIHVILA